MLNIIDRRVHGGLEVFRIYCPTQEAYLTGVLIGDGALYLALLKIGLITAHGDVDHAMKVLIPVLRVTNCSIRGVGRVPDDDPWRSEPPGHPPPTEGHHVRYAVVSRHPRGGPYRLVRTQDEMVGVLREDFGLGSDDVERVLGWMSTAPLGSHLTFGGVHVFCVFDQEEAEE